MWLEDAGGNGRGAARALRACVVWRAAANSFPHNALSGHLCAHEMPLERIVKSSSVSELPLGGASWSCLEAFAEAEQFWATFGS